MQFNHLIASAKNNADQAPNLFMALCMVESLFQDMEDVSHQDISQCPTGDDRLPTKLVWLCRTILDIYDDHSDDLQRNRARLDGAVAKVRSLEKELEQLASASEQLAGIQDTYARLEEQLRKAGEKRQQYEQLKAAAARAETELQELRQFDPATAQAELERLQRELTENRNRKDELQSQLLVQRRNAAELHSSVTLLENERDQNNVRVSEMNAQLDALTEASERAKAQLEELARQRICAEEELEEKKRLCVQKQDDLTQLRQEISTYHAEHLEPVQTELENCQRKKSTLAQQLAAAQAEVGNHQAKIDELTVAIGRLRNEKDSETAKLAEAKSRYERAGAELQLKKEERDAAVHALTLLQSEVANLEENVLPERRKLLADEEKRKNELAERIDETSGKLQKLSEERDILEVKLPALEAKLKNNQDVYASLTAEYMASTNELKELEHQISQLSNQNDAQKVMIYKQQLQSNLDALQQTKAECERIRQENVLLCQKLEQAQAEKTRLSELREKHQSGNDAIARLMRELEPCKAQEYAREVELVCCRLELLQNVYGRMISSVQKMRQVLGCAPFAEELPLDDKLRDELRRLREYAEDQNNMLLKWANSLNMEET